MIIPNENIIVKINSCKQLAHRMDHSKPNYFIVCPRRLQRPRDDSAVGVQMFSSMVICIKYLLYNIKTLLLYKNEIKVKLNAYAGVHVLGRARGQHCSLSSHLHPH